MAKLPSAEDLGARPIAQPSRIINRYEGGAIGRALQGTAQVVDSIGFQLKQQEDYLARQNAALAEQRYKNFVTEKTQEVGLRVASGELLAQQAVDEEFKKISETGRKQFFEGISGRFLPSVQVAADSVDINHRGDLHKALFVSQQQQQVANLNALVQEKTRGALLPGADVDEAAREIDFAFETFGKSLPPDKRAIEKGAALDNLRNSNITRQVQFAPDAERLTGILNTVQVDPNIAPEDKLRQTTLIQNRLEEIARAENAQRAKVEGAAKEVVSKLKGRTGSVTPPTNEEIQQGYAVAELGGQGEAYQQALSQLNTVNDLARRGSAVQQQWLLDEERRQQLEGATEEDVKNLAEIRTGLEKAGKLSQQDPIAFAERYTTVPVGDIDFSNLESEQGQAELGIILQQRVLANDAVRALHGAEVNEALLKESESASFKAAFEKANAQQKQDLLVSLSEASPDAQTYQRLVEQTVGQGSVYGGAGAFLSRDETRVTKTSLFNNATTVTTQEIGAAILRGQDLINTKAAIPPSDAWLTEQFRLATGDAFEFADGAEVKRLIDTATAYGVGRGLLIKNGLGQYDPEKLKEAVSDVLGEVVEFNDHSVILPWGMPEDTFVDTAQERLEAAFQSGALVQVPGQPPLTEDDLESLRLVNVRDGVYRVLRGYTPIGELDVLSSTGTAQAAVSLQDIRAPILAAGLRLPTGQGGEIRRSDSFEVTVNDSSGKINKQFTDYPLVVSDATKEESNLLLKFRDDWSPVEEQSAKTTRDLAAQVLVDSESGLQDFSGEELVTVSSRDPRLAVLAKEASDAVGLNPEFLNQVRLQGERSQSRGGKGKSISHKDAGGVYQFIPATGRDYGLYDFRDPVLSTIAAARFGKDLQTMYNGNIAAMLAHYNGGPKQADPVVEGKQPPAKETRNYLVRTLRSWFAIDPAAAQQTGKYRLPK